MKLSVPANRQSSGAEMEVLVEDVAFGGQGVARVQGRVIFVPGVLTGERAVVGIVRQTARYAIAECRRIITPSPDRVPPPCPYYGRCGGCQYQHVLYARQLEFKRKQAADILRRIGGLTDQMVDPMVPSPMTYAYRNKITLHGPGRPGFHGAPGAPLIPIEACRLALKAVNDQIPGVARLNLAAREDLIIRVDTQGRVGWYRQYGGMMRSLSGGSLGPEPLTEIVQGRPLQCPVRSFF